MFHYELADEGSEAKSLNTLTSAVEKILDIKQRDLNRRAQAKAGAVPGMAAEARPMRKKRRKKHALLADNLSDTSSDTSSTQASKVACPAINDECKQKGLCYQFQRGNCKFGDKCKYKHEKCSTPPPPGFVKTRKGKGRGKRKSCSRSSSLDSRASTPDPRSAEQKAKVACRHFKKGSCRLGDKCPYKH